VAESDAPAVEERLEQLCRVFEENKAHLAKRWSS
jgi:hypothetical protein